MEGHLRKKGKYWHAVIHMPVDPRTGQDHQISRSTKCTSKREAQEVLRKMLAEMDVNPALSSASGRMPLADWLGIWLREDSSLRAVNTQSQYESLCRNHIIPSPIGKVQLAKLDKPTLQQWVNQLSKAPRKDRNKGNLSPTTVKRTFAVLRVALNRAVALDIIAKSPITHVKPPRQEAPDVHAMGPDEVGRFLEAAQDSRFFTLFWVCLSAGLRIGEALALRWSDVMISDDRVLIHIQHSLRRGKGTVEERLSDTKTRQSNRYIDLGDEAKILLREHRKDQLQQRLLAGPLWHDNDLVFPSRTGNPMNDSNIRDRYYNPILERAGLPHFRIHDMRHTMATIAMSLGVPTKIVSAQLGHSRPDTTRNIYQHALPSEMQTTSNLIEQAMLGKRQDRAKTRK